MTRRSHHFDYSEQDGVATLTFNRPERLNALTFEVYADIRELSGQLKSRMDDVRVLVIRGKGRGFCSGGDMGICWLLPRLVGLGRASEMLMLGGPVTAEEAVRIGLASRVVPDQDLDAAVAGYVARLKEAAPWGLAMTKEMLNRAAGSDYSTAVEMEAWTQTLLMTSADFREFHAGYTGRRRPVFKGR